MRFVCSYISFIIWRLFSSNLYIIFNTVVLTINVGPSVMRALPLAAGINDGGHYFAYFSLGPSEVRATSGAT